MYALDNLRDPVSAMGVRFGNFIYHGRSDTHSARRRCNCTCNRPLTEAIIHESSGDWIVGLQIEIDKG